MLSKIDSKQLGKLLLVVYLILFLPLAYLLFQANQDLNEFSMNPGFITSDKISSIFLSIIFLIGFTFLIGLVSILSFQFYTNRNTSSLEIMPQEEIEEAIKKEKPEEKSTISKIDINILSNKIELISQTENFDELLIALLCKYLHAGLGAIFRTELTEDSTHLVFSAGYAFHRPNKSSLKIHFGEGLTGQVAKNQKTIIVEDSSEDSLKIVSGLGYTSPKSVAIIPIVKQQKTIAVIEIASLNNSFALQKDFFDQLSQVLTSKI